MTKKFLNETEEARAGDRDPELSLIIPTYMEAKNIEELIKRVESALSGFSFEIIVVDDNSPDGTANLAKMLNKKYGNIRVLERPGKLGLGSAVIDGFKASRSSVLAVMDADLQHPPELLPKMYKKILEGYDLVIASRYISGGRIEGWSLLRKIISLGAIKLTYLFIPRTRMFKDPLSGFFMIRRECINDIVLDVQGFKILLEIIIKGKFNSAVEVSYTFTSRLKGKSKLNMKEILNYIFTLLRLRMKSKV